MRPYRQQPLRAQEGTTIAVAGAPIWIGAVPNQTKVNPGKYIMPIGTSQTMGSQVEIHLPDVVGPRYAQDTGADVFGYRIDVYVGTSMTKQDCVTKFGRRNAKVTFIGY